MIRYLKPKIKFLALENEISNDISNSVISFSVQKNLSQIAGAFTIQLLPDAGKISTYSSLPLFYNMLNPGDLVSIGFSESGSILIGSIDNVYKSKDVTTGLRIINIRGRDFGKYLVDDSSFPGNFVSEKTQSDIIRKLIESKICKNQTEAENHPLAKLQLNYMLPRAADGSGTQDSFIGMKLDEAIKFVLRATSSMRLKTNFAGDKEKAIHELLKISLKTRKGETIQSSNVNAFTGSIINFLYTLVDKDFYEIFIETINETPILTIRPRPFDRESDQITINENKMGAVESEHTWEKLKGIDGTEKKIILESDIINSNLGVSSFETYSFYTQEAINVLMGIALSNASLELPLVDFYALKKFGLKSKNSQSKLISLTYDDDGMIENESIIRICGFRDRMFNWNRYNNILENGDVNIFGKEEIKLGDKIYLQDEIGKNGEKGILFYCSGYSHSWKYGEAFTTSLQLMRGETATVIKKFKEYTDKWIVR